MKKIIAFILSLMLIASLSVSVFADEPETETGSITINGVSGSTTYEIYKLLDLESYDVKAGAYSYKANAAWTAFFASDEAKAYMATDADGYVTWVAAEDDDTKATFAKLALAYAKAHKDSINPVKSSKNNGEFVITENSGKFSGLELGYYLVDSTMGALCGLTTTNPDASINAKNGIPTVDKQVQEDSTEQWGAHNTADIGQIVKYRVTIDVHAGAENYVLHDVMEAGLTFQNQVTIERVVPGTGTQTVNTDQYTVVTGEDIDDDCTFEVHFTKEMCDKLETNDKIIVYYTAMLNSSANIAEIDSETNSPKSNKNTAWLTFGEGGESNKDSVDTYTYRIDIVKTDSANKLINGAKFRIYDAATGGNEVAVVKMSDGTYCRTGAEGVNIVVTDGKVRVVGFDNGTYYLEETVAPAGYNKLSARQKFIISDGNLDATFNGEVYSTGSGVHVDNKPGTMLPETGGMGTILFITFGTIVVLGAGVLLVTKKRMSMIKD